VRDRAAALVAALGEAEFAIGAAARVWKVSARSANRFLRECIEAGLVVSRGKGSRTRYRSSGKALNN
jgi:Fic family protein